MFRYWPVRSRATDLIVCYRGFLNMLIVVDLNRMPGILAMCSPRTGCHSKCTRLGTRLHPIPTIPNAKGFLRAVASCPVQAILDRSIRPPDRR